ncbi:glycosyltransferase [Nitrospirillum iridis]|uniref:Glycosyltransferase involved in cell wall biosynthesis n=1 Tax=Nitrospirillum iridis TaxID=765888 RepID=A0A7X0B0T8_9PROT|nr:glycosyltransferase [Nitrospirillum iridis]MBB6253699.1 glycosyltransferase involved in cell wall biosynthesis [Nitrospirillum iridis]
MRILVVHCRYQRRGGEDVAVDREMDALERHGATVLRHIADNAAIEGAGSLRTAARAIWSTDAYRDVQRAIAVHRPDVVHVHNTFAYLSPSVLAAAHATGTPVVQTLHNYRLACPGGLLTRNGAACEDCVGRQAKWPALVHGCYRDSKSATAVVMAMLAFHEARGTWNRDVDLFLAPSPAARDVLLRVGLPASRTMVKPNFVPDPGAGAASWGGPRSGAVAVARLDKEKGLRFLVDLWRGVDMDLTIIGDGPLRQVLEESDNPRIRFAGARTSDEVSNALASAELLLVPSLFQETFALVAVEAQAHGVPVMASDLGACRDWITPGWDGFLVPPGDAEAWRAALTRWRALSRDERAAMGGRARAAYDAVHRPERVVQYQISLYEGLLTGRRAHEIGQA